MARLQSTFKTHQLTQQRVVATVSLVSMITAQKGIQFPIRIQSLIIGQDHLHAAAPHPRAGDLHQARRHAGAALRKVLETLLDQIIGRQAIERHRIIILSAFAADFQHPFIQ